jgi:hypothetical protein
MPLTDVPDDREVDLIVLVDDEIAERDDLTPGDLRVLRTESLGEPRLASPMIIS